MNPVRFTRLDRRRPGWHVFTNTRPADHLGVVQQVVVDGQAGWAGHHFATSFEGPLRRTRAEAALDLLRNREGTA